MATSPEEILKDAYDDVKNDVTAAIKSHPQYQQLLDALAAKGLAELFALVGATAA